MTKVGNAKGRCNTQHPAGKLPLHACPVSLRMHANSRQHPAEHPPCVRRQRSALHRCCVPFTSVVLTLPPRMAAQPMVMGCCNHLPVSIPSDVASSLRCITHHLTTETARAYPSMTTTCCTQHATPGLVAAAHTPAIADRGKQHKCCGNRSTKGNKVWRVSPTYPSLRGGAA